MPRSALLSMDLQVNNLARVPAEYLPAAPDPELHNTLVTKVFNRRGDVLATSERKDALKASAAGQAASRAAQNAQLCVLAKPVSVCGAGGTSDCIVWLTSL